ncbi:MAG: glycosyltransferase family 2 protein [Bdellovibrionota bacterium]
MSKIFVITPVFNEEENVQNLVQGWRDIKAALPDYEFVFLPVDDGSSDTTVATFEQNKGALNFQILKHEVNRGPGAAFATGFTYVSDKMNPGDLVVTMEGDNTSRIETLMRMIQRQKNESIDVVLASPFAYGGSIKTDLGFFRLLLSTFANVLVKVMLDIRGIHTYSSFFRVYRAESIQALQKAFGPEIIYCSGFEGMVEMLAKITHLQLSVSEVPLTLDWALRKGKSKMKVFKTTMGYFRLFYVLRSTPKPVGLK